MDFLGLFSTRWLSLINIHWTSVYYDDILSIYYKLFLIYYHFVLSRICKLIQFLICFHGLRVLYLISWWWLLWWDAWISRKGFVDIWFITMFYDMSFLAYLQTELCRIFGKNSSFRIKFNFVILYRYLFFKQASISVCLASS